MNQYFDYPAQTLPKISMCFLQLCESPKNFTDLGGLHSTEVAFALLTPQQPRVRFPAFPKVFQTSKSQGFIDDDA